MSANNKHAYLIIAHGNPYVLEKLILLLDDERNDIFIHIDKKIKEFDFAYFQKVPQKSKLIFTKRIDVYWGHVSQIHAELLLFKMAVSTNEYSRYHLLSGADLPLRSQDDLHYFFEKHSSTEFIGISHFPYEKYKIDKIHFNRKYLMKSSNYTFRERFNRFYSRLFVSLQKLVGYKHHSQYRGEVRYGLNWVSVTHQFVIYLVEQESWIRCFFKYSLCGDEFYKQILAVNSKFKESLYDIGDDLKGSQRKVEWEGNNPRIYRTSDFEELMNSPYLFARKFQDVVDTQIVDMIYNHIKVSLSSQSDVK